MGEDAASGPPAKKRGASRQISKDDDSDSDAAPASPSESGTFKKASDDVLAGRRIVKVRRSTTPAASAPNPFAAIRLEAPSAVAKREAAPEGAEAATAAVVRSEDVEKTATGNDEMKQQQVENAGNNQGPDEAQELSKEKPDLERRETVSKDVEDKNVIHPKEGDECVVEPTNVEDKCDLKEKNVEDQCDAKKTNIEDKGDTKETNVEVKPSVVENCREPEKNVGNDENKNEKEDKASTVATSGDEPAPTAGGEGSAKSPAVGSFSFGTGGGFASFSSSWSFGAGAATGASTAFASNGSTFQLFGSQAAPTSLATSYLSQPPPTSVQFQEVVVKTGEEQERVIFAADATLFEFADGSWKERGKGELKVNVPEDKGSKPRLLMRSKGNYKLLLNAGLFPDIKMTNMDTRGVTFACINSAVEGKTGLTTYAVKFRDSVSAGNFRDAVDAHKGVTQTVLKTPENSPRAHES